MRAPRRKAERKRQAYFLPIGFLVVGAALLPGACAGLAELVMGLLQVAAGLGVPFHELMSLLLNIASDNRRRVSRPNLHLNGNYCLYDRDSANRARKVARGRGWRSAAPADLRGGERAFFPREDPASLTHSSCFRNTRSLSLNSSKPSAALSCATEAQRPSISPASQREPADDAVRVEQRDPGSVIAGLGNGAAPVGLAGLVAARGNAERRPTALPGEARRVVSQQRRHKLSAAMAPTPGTVTSGRRHHCAPDIQLVEASELVAERVAGTSIGSIAAM